MGRKINTYNLLKRYGFSKLKKANAKEKYKILRELGYLPDEAKFLKSLSYENFRIYHDLRVTGFTPQAAGTLLNAYNKAENPLYIRKREIEKQKKKLKKTIERIAKKKKVSKRSVKFVIQRKSKKDIDFLLVSGKNIAKFKERKEEKK